MTTYLVSLLSPILTLWRTWLVGLKLPTYQILPADVTDTMQQVLHFLLGIIVILLLTVLSNSVLLSFLLLVLLVVAKEGVFDFAIEKSTVAQSVEDTVWWLLGGLSALLFVLFVKG